MRQCLGCEAKTGCLRWDRACRIRNGAPVWSSREDWASWTSPLALSECLHFFLGMISSWQLRSLSSLTGDLMLFQLISINPSFFGLLSFVVLALLPCPVRRILVGLLGGFACPRPMEAWKDVARERASCCHLLRHDANWTTRESDAPER